MSNLCKCFYDDDDRRLLLHGVSQVIRELEKHIERIYGRPIGDPKIPLILSEGHITGVHKKWIDLKKRLENTPICKEEEYVTVSVPYSMLGIKKEGTYECPVPKSILKLAGGQK